VAPIIFVNVLDPATHKTTVSTPVAVALTSKQGTIKATDTPVTGILLSSVKVKASAEATANLILDTDYTLDFDENGYVVITVLAGGAAASATSVYVTYDKLDPSAVTGSTIIGATSGSSETGLEVLRQIYPRFGMTPGLILAPGWSQITDVALVLQAKCEEINGYFSCETFIDIDSGTGGCTLYSNVKTAKESAGISSPHAMPLWPCVKAGSKVLWASAIWGALTAYTDAQNDDVPNLSPSNKSLPITGTCLRDGTEVLLDQVQANAVNGAGVSTAINLNGWRSWGNNSAAYPSTTDPKDRWFCVRRFFSWWGNSFMLTYAQKVDDPANPRLVESVVDTENIRGQAYVQAGKCAAISVEYNEAENTVTDILNGKVTFHLHLAPYTPAEDILGILEFDPDALQAALNGGE
jgi:phage tail sheath protein FI